MRTVLLRSIVSVLCLAVSILGIIWTVKAGLARTLSEYVVRANVVDPVNTINTLPAADMALRTSPSDPEAHLARGIVLAEVGQLDEAIAEFRNAIALRPGHYKSWLRLGSALDQNGEQEASLQAFNEAVRLAPNYAQPRWELGNALFRMGRMDEAFREMRQGVTGDPALLPLMIDYAWVAFQGDAGKVKEVVRPDTPQAKVALARYFARKGNSTDAIELFNQAGQVADTERRALLSELLASKKFDEAYKVWASGSGEATASPSGSLIDGGFEKGISTGAVGFGWIIPSTLSNVEVSLDTAERRGGDKSLTFIWSGNSDPLTPVLSQLVLVEPNARYRLHFVVRTKEIKTGGPPLISVTDASGKDAKALAKSPVFPSETSPWQEYTVDFSTEGETRAVLISLLRQNCTGSPCPAFGQVWLDDFSLQKL